MIKILKIQKGVFVIVLGVIAIVGYSLMVVRKSENSEYVLGFAGVLFILGSLMLLYPILTAKKDKDGIVQLDPEKAELAEKEAERSSADAAKEATMEPVRDAKNSDAAAVTKRVTAKKAGSVRPSVQQMPVKKTIDT